MALLPLLTIVLIAALIVRSRWRFTLPRRPRVRPQPPQRPAGTLLPFDREKMDDELAKLLRKR